MDTKEIIEKTKSMQEELTELRHSIHAHPELSWKEAETSRLIEQRLRELGFKNIRRGFRGTESGVVADLEGNRPKPCVALRADIDALPITEETGLPYASKVPGVMHACGHDAHATILLGAAKVLASMKDRIPGTVRLIFQPAEEAGNDSGAPAMIAQGALDGVDGIAGLHVWSELPLGVFGYRKGSFMASADLWEMTIQGKGGHGSAPHKAVDPTMAVAHIISLLQTVVSREIDPLESAVLSVGKVESGNAPNVIPDKAVITGNVRTTNRETRLGMEERMRRVIEGVSSALRCETKFVYTQIYPVTVNDSSMTDILTAAAADVLGTDAVRETPILMGSEDFSYYGEKIPATYGILGMGDAEKETDRPHHSPRFRTNDAVLASGAAVLARFALRFLEERADR